MNSPSTNIKAARTYNTAKDTQTDHSLCLMMAKIPTKKDSGPTRENMTESVIESMENKGLPTIVGFTLTATAPRSESAVSTTEAIPNPTAHLPKRVFGIKSIFIYFYSTKKSPDWRFLVAPPAGRC